ncbi:MAG: cysteine synthase A [Caulobacteraceae bacterium]|nr:cysteine synthase A [Caulobacteraceae bacterium]
MKYDSILQTIGNTPVVKLGAIAPRDVSIYVKIEAFNPMGSVKDRLALAAIEDAERRGLLKPGQTVVEATSGNTGIGLAMVCAKKGYPLVIVMAENFSIERRRLMRFLGARVVLTPAADKGSGMLAKATELAETHGWFLTRQFENEANAEVHSRTTAQEILRDFEGERLDYWVTTYGTGGTAKGVARALKAMRPETKIVVTEPDNSQVLGTGLTDRFRPHPIQGTSPDFIAKLMADAKAAGWIDEILPVNGGDALRLSRELATKEGIFAGISSGATVAAALKIAETAPKGSTILAMLPDTGERYLSTPLFEDIAIDMTPEEEAISKSSPSNRFDIRPVPAPAAQTAPVAADAEATAFVEKLIVEEPVLLFALEWCEFCWATRKLFKAHGVAYRSIDLDSVAMQKDDWGGRVRREVGVRAGATTIPQVFIGGELIGGNAEMFEAVRSGQLQAKLRAAGVAFDADAKVDYGALLPKWLKKSA